MNRFTVGKQHDTQVSIPHLRHRTPSSDPAIFPNMLSFRRGYNSLHPPRLDHRAIFSLRQSFEVLGNLHYRSVSAISRLTLQ
jgi:hypothetical protein